MIDINELTYALAHMNKRMKLFMIVRAEMERRGHWKQLPRGKAFGKGQDVRRNDNPNK